ncbi:MAG: transcriptional repressor [Gammaproteobacteria bacterium]|nr:transcriptional repressor [Gammaproteobacteria bacterium]
MDSKRLAGIMEQAEALCRERGVRLTPQRRTVLELVCAAERPMSAYDILDLMRSSISNPAPPTVYRALDFLLEQGLVHKLESIHAFVGCSHPDHPHASQFLICADCGDVSELEDPAIARSLRAAETASGFAPKRRVVELIGSCARCTAKAHE